MDYHLVYCSILQVILHICSAFVCSFIFPCFISKSLKDKLNVERGVFVSFPKRQFKILLECDDSGSITLGVFVGSYIILFLFGNDLKELYFAN